MNEIFCEGFIVGKKEVEKNMNVIYIVLFIIPLIFILWIYMSLAFFPEDRKARQDLRRYGKYKGILYGVLILFTIVYECVIEGNKSPTVFVTLCISSFEMCQCIVQAKADEYIDKVMEEMEYNKEKNEKNIIIQGKHLKKFATYKIDLLYKNAESDYFTQSIYEELKDYFKYYPSANNFMNIVENFIKNPEEYSKEELERELDSCISDIVCFENEIIRVPLKW